MLRPPPRPGSDEVHLWFADLEREDPGRFVPFLSPDELARAGSCHFRRDRDRFIVRRGWLRTLLAGYTGVNAQDVRFCEGRYGKPLLAPAAGCEDVHFNLSCSGNAALVAVARGSEVGVDLERLRHFPDADRIVGRFFSPAERKAFLRLDRNERPGAFVQYWTAKEAFVKATGEGLSRPLDTFDVALSPDTASLIGEQDRSPAEWSLRSFLLCGRYAAAVVVNRRSFSIRPFNSRAGLWYSGGTAPIPKRRHRGAATAAGEAPWNRKAHTRYGSLRQTSNRRYAA